MKLPYTVSQEMIPWMEINRTTWRKTFFFLTFHNGPDFQNDIHRTLRIVYLQRTLPTMYCLKWLTANYSKQYILIYFASARKQIVKWKTQRKSVILTFINPSSCFLPKYYKQFSTFIICCMNFYKYTPASLKPSTKQLIRSEKQNRVNFRRLLQRQFRLFP